MNESSTAEEIARDDRAHVQRLIAAWGIVADFCFGDLLLFIPRMVSSTVESFTVAGQIRPTTSRTLYTDDLVGREVSLSERPLLLDSWNRRVILDGQNFTVSGGLAARVEYVPVVRLVDGAKRVVGVLTSESPIDVARRPGRLERVYFEIFGQIANMIANGLFPFAPMAEPDDLVTPAEPPRVGDGVIVLGSERTVTYASPNAVSGLHRLGVFANAEGRTLGTLGVGLGVAEQCFSTRLPVLAEVDRVNPESENRLIFAVKALPLLAPAMQAETARVSGAVVLLRDVSDVRRRDRLLVSKDATIREVHHRVKNNLQTISALLRLQGRRTTSDEARQAIEESARRIRAIALVHETLSRDVRDAVPFDEIVRPLVRMVEESIVSPDRPIRIRVEGSVGDLPPEIATPLAVVLTELLQNAVEHGYPPLGESDRHLAATPGQVRVVLSSTATALAIEVRDDGVGLPESFSLAASKSLGLSIVRTLVTTEMAGVISFRTDNGTVAQLRIPRTIAT